MIKAKFTAGGLSKYFAKQETKLDILFIRELQILGEKVVNLCRDLDTYQDDTGNLRSSIGYAVVANHSAVVVKTESRPGKGSESGSAGEAAAKEIIDTLMNSVKTDYALIIVAGADYAEAVEFHGFPVLTPGEHLAESELPKIKARIKQAFQKAKI